MSDNEKPEIPEGVMAAVRNRGIETTKEELRASFLEPGGIKYPFGPLGQHLSIT